MATMVAARVGSHWTRPLVVLGVCLLAILVIFASDAADMARQWWGSSTYQHCLFLVPITGWLLWQRRDEVARQTPAGWPPGLALVFAAALVWLIGEAGGVALLRHVGLVAMVQATVVAVLGPAVARAILFPLFYLIFLVPFGDEFVGPMQTLTARMTMALLGWTGIPAHLDGVFITTPAGWFEVAEACAGVKFLVAMVVYAALAAHVCFRSNVRRALFMAAAVIVPVLANGVRAWGTIFAAELTSVKFATGFDHVVYGWFFFAAITVLVMAVAWRFFDRRIGEPWLDGKVFAVWRPTAPVMLMAPLAIAVVALPPLWDAVASRDGRVALPGAVVLPDVPGWTRSGDGPAVPWVPRFDGADHRLFGRYGNTAGRHVDVAAALYGWQGKGREVVGYGQGAADPNGVWKWAADLPPIAGGRNERLLGPHAVARQAVTFWDVGGQPVGSRGAVKFATLRTRLAGGSQSAATLIVSAEEPGAREAIAAFVAALRAPQSRIDAMFTQARRR